MTFMDTQILNFVEQMEAKLLNDIVIGNELEHDLYDIATELLENNDKDAYANICQAYEVVKHNLLGTTFTN